MSELTLLILRFGFLALLWVFIFVIVYAMRSDLFGQRVRRLPEATITPPEAFISPETLSETEQPERATTANAQKIVVTSGPKSGAEIKLTGEPLTIGRSADSSLVIRDDYTSTHHARLLLWNDQWVIQDLDSTNGTFLNGTRVSQPTPVPLDTPIIIGATHFELRR